MKRPATPSDEDLLVRFIKGDELAFKLIFERYSSEMYLSAYNLFRDKATCEDMIQEIFIDLWNKKEQLNIKKLKPFLYGCVRNKVLMAIRSKKKSVSIEEVEHLCAIYTADMPVEVKELKDMITAKIEVLPERCKEIFYLSREENLSNKEIADKLNISIKTVENQMTIALRRIRSSMAEFLVLLIVLLLS